MLAKTTVSHSQTATVNVNQQGSLPPPSGLPPKSWMNHGDGRDHRADLDDEHHRVADLHARVELAQRRRAARGRTMSRRNSEMRTAAGLIGRSLLVEGEVELEHVDAGLAEDAEDAAVGVVGRSSCRTVASESWRTAAMRWAWMRGVGLRDVRVDA